jgi:hypothetical protein
MDSQMAGINSPYLNVVDNKYCEVFAHKEIFTRISSMMKSRGYPTTPVLLITKSMDNILIQSANKLQDRLIYLALLSLSFVQEDSCS